MTKQILDLQYYNLNVLEDSEMKNLNGGAWWDVALKIIDALSRAEAINDMVNGFKAGYKDGANSGHGASGTW
jgi:hypothetical protein